MNSPGIDSFAITMIQMTCELNEEIKQLPHVYQYIAMAEGDSNLQFYQVAQKVIIGESEGFPGDLISVYFAYEIAYPKPLYPVLLFLQRFVIDIQDCQPVPPALTRVLSVQQKYLSPVLYSCHSYFQCHLLCTVYKLLD